MLRLRRTLAAAAAALLALTIVPAGATEPAPNFGARTIGGVDADPDSPVNQAGTYLEITAPDGQRYLCSGTLITKVHVLTAKHCVYTENTDTQVLETATAYIGLDRFNPADKSTVSASGVKVHPAADLAVLTLDQPANNTTPAKVWGGDVNIEETEFFASGFGTGANSDALWVLGEARIDVTGRQSFTLTGVDDKPQPGYSGYPVGGTRITQGDSGGPLHNYHQVLGVNSGVAPQAPHGMSFVPTQDYGAWIDSVAPGSVEGPREGAAAPLDLPAEDRVPAPLSGPSPAEAIPSLVAAVQSRVSDLLGLN